MNKKALFSLEEFIKIVFTAALVVAVLYVSWQLVKVIAFPDQEHDYSVRNFETLSKEVEELLNNPAEYAYTTDTVYVKKGYMIVGFDSGSNAAFGLKRYWDGSKRIQKPERCGKEACMCLFESYLDDEDETADNEVIKCTKFQEKTNFFSSISDIPNWLSLLENLRGQKRSDSSFDQSNVPDNKKLVPEYLILYGLRFYGTFPEFHIEKIREGDTNKIIIVPATKKTENRNLYYEACSESSVAECRGRFADETFGNGGNITSCQIANRETLRCTSQPIPECPGGTLITNACSCNGKEYRNGYCFGTKPNRYYSDINCNEVSSCSDYCSVQSPSSCSTNEQITCNLDPCRLDCEMKPQGRDATLSCV